MVPFLFQDLVDFLAENKVRIVASMPCYGPKNVDEQVGLTSSLCN